LKCTAVAGYNGGMCVSDQVDLDALVAREDWEAVAREVARRNGSLQTRIVEREDGSVLRVTHDELIGLDVSASELPAKPGSGGSTLPTPSA
jgi:hypothetical protein